VQHAGSRWALDGTMAGAFLLLLLWILVREEGGGTASAVSSATMVAGGVYVAARIATRIAWWITPAVLLVAAAGLAVVHRDVLYSGPLSSPLGYSNATGAFYVVVAAGAWLLTARTRIGALRVVGVVGALAATTVPWGNGATTAAVMSLLAPLGLLVRPLGGRVRTAVVLAAVIAVTALASTTYLGLTYTGQRELDRSAAELLSERRPVLWGEAAELMLTHPLRGVGPGRFAVESAEALSDQDARWAHHELLQLGAETGVPGLALAVALLFLVLARMWAGPRDPGTAVAALGTAAVAVLSSVDYVLHFPAVLAAAAAVAGTAVAPPGRGYASGRSRRELVGPAGIPRPLHGVAADAD
jgi:O-antigen ligase